LASGGGSEVAVLGRMERDWPLLLLLLLLVVVEVLLSPLVVVLPDSVVEVKNVVGVPVPVVDDVVTI
jgi:hypothetical protein